MRPSCIYSVIQLFSCFFHSTPLSSFLPHLVILSGAKDLVNIHKYILTYFGIGEIFPNFEQSERI